MVLIERLKKEKKDRSIVLPHGIESPGVEVEYAGNENCVDNEIMLNIGDKSFSFKTRNPGGWYGDFIACH